MANVIISEEEYNDLKKDCDIWRDRYYELRYALRKDETLDESISCVRDIPSDVEMIEDLKKRAADSDFYKEKSELLEAKLKKANDVVIEAKRLREANEDLLEKCKGYITENAELKLEVEKDKKFNTLISDLYKQIQEWKEKCIARDIDVDHLISLNKELDKKISELESRRSYWEKKAIENAANLQKTMNDRDKWRSLYNSLSGICSDYDKRCKEECEKKYRDEISKLQNIVTEKEVEIRGLRKDNVYLNQNKLFADAISEKNTELNQTISDQDITIKALLLTIKEMCKEDETNA